MTFRVFYEWAGLRSRFRGLSIDGSDGSAIMGITCGG